MVNLNPFKHRPPSQMTELHAAIANGCAQAAAGQQSSDVQQQRAMLENALLIDDQHIGGLMSGMSRYTFTDDEGKIGPKGQTYEGAIPKYVAADIANSHLIRTGWIDERQARIMTWEYHALFLRMKMMMSEEEYEEGGALVLDSDFEVVKMNVLSAINGRLAKLVKSNPRSVDVTVGQAGPNQERL
jgi:hypothetical protein